MFSISTAHAAAPAFAVPSLPTSSLELDILEPFLPLIEEEIAHEFAHQDDGRTRRDTREYGHSFFKMMNKDFTYSPPPPFLQELGAQICLKMGYAPREFTNIILSLYEAGFHLEPHVDVHADHPDAANGFFFDEEVFGIIIEPDASGHLYFVHYEEGIRPPLTLPEVCHLEEKRGTIFCLTTPYRRAPFFHGVSNVSKRRISITFRTVQKS